MKIKVVLSRCFLGVALCSLIFLTHSVFAAEENSQNSETQMPDDIVDNFPEDEICFQEDNEPSRYLPDTLKIPKIIKVQNVREGIRLQWKKVKYADEYRVRRRTPGGSWKTIQSVKGASYVDRAVKKRNGMVYLYRIVVYASNQSKAIEAYGSNSESGKFVRLCDPSRWKLKRSGTRGMAVSWKKNKKAAGVQIQYGTSRKFSGAKSVRVSSGKTKKNITIARSKKKKYYVRLRYYKKVGKKIQYSPWSKEKSKKIGGRR